MCSTQQAAARLWLLGMALCVHLRLDRPLLVLLREEILEKMPDMSAQDCETFAQRLHLAARHAPSGNTMPQQVSFNSLAHVVLTFGLSNVVWLEIADQSAEVLPTSKLSLCFVAKMKTEVAAFCAVGGACVAAGALQGAFVSTPGVQDSRGHLRATHIASQPPTASGCASSGAVVLASAAAGMAAAAVGSKSRRARTQQKARGGFDTVKSEEVFTEAKELMPGGVSSPVRAFKSVGGNPIVFDRVKGAYAWDVDGNQYVDYVGTWGPAIIGHADDTVLKALNEQMQKGTSFGAPCALENELAKMVIDAVPSVEMVRFTNSGTEACMGMLRLVRAFTKKDVVIKFEGCYHGHGDAFLVQAGSGVATLGLPDSPGVPKGATTSTLCAQYNNLESVEELLKENEVAAVILEPVVGNSGFIPPTKEFLVGLRELTTKYGALLVFDEVMTGFRIAYGGAQEHFGVTPDVTTMGALHLRRLLLDFATSFHRKSGCANPFTLGLC